MIETRVTRLHVVEKGEPIFHEGSFSVSIEDHAAESLWSSRRLDRPS